MYPEPTVGAVIFGKDDKILLCKSHKWNNQYVIPGGHIELGESMEDALKREVLEETGLAIFDIRLIGIKECIYSSTFHAKKHFLFIDYVCRTDSDKVVLNDEAQEYAWVAMEEIDDYELGGFTRDLFVRMRDGVGTVGIYYNY